MKENFLVELGCEELPSKVMMQISKSLKEEIIKELQQETLEFDKVEAFVSPRHLAVKVVGLPHKQQSKTIVRKGPSKKAAFNENNEPTPALQGFLKSSQMSLEQINFITEPKGEWVVCEITQEGQNTTELLENIVNTAIKNLPIAKPMRWGSNDYAFVRPVHWLVMMFGSHVIPATVLGLQADRKTYGHRFHHPQEIILKHVDEYESCLHAAKVIVDFETRKQVIASQIKACAKSNNAALIENEDLLNEVTTIVEWPTAILVPFDKTFLSVPKEALIESMASHQKCFSLEDDSKNLLPYFITVSNIEPKSKENIVLGNERVMRARLSDAKFFYEQDKKSSLKTKGQKLKNIIFQKQLGSTQDKVNRVTTLAVEMAHLFGANKKVVERSALLSKSSLVTEMVGEFPSLQDVMGYYYAINDGESEEVAKAVREYYLPRFSGDALPSTKEASVVAIADRIDTLVGIFGINQKPTGVKDPFQLRRLSLAVIRLLIDLKAQESIGLLLQKSIACFNFSLPNTETLSDVQQFFIDRFIVYATKQLGLRVDVVKAILHQRSDVTFYDVLESCQTLQTFVEHEDSKSLIQGCKRVSNLLKQQDIIKLQSQDINVNYISEPQEQSLYEAMISQKQKLNVCMLEKDHKNVLQVLSTFKKPVDDFFEHVMVNVDDLRIRQNRLVMLAHLEKCFSQFAAFSLIQDA